MSQSGVFRSYFACDALVHENYAKSEDWHSSVGFAVLDDPLIVPGDLGQTAGKVATTLQAFYPAGQVTIRKRKLEDLNGIAPPGKSVLLSMELHLSVKDLPTAYDKLLIVVVELADGEYAIVVRGQSERCAEGRGEGPEVLGVHRDRQSVAARNPRRLRDRGDSLCRCLESRLPITDTSDRPGPSPIRR